MNRGSSSRRVARAVESAFIVGSLLLLFACQRDLPQRQRAIFILLDALRADRLSCYGYERETTPNLDALAERGVLFRRHFVHDTATRGSLPQILYSRYFIPPLFPGSPNVPLASPNELFQTADQESISLPRALSRTGIDTAAISAHSWLREGTSFAREFDELHDLATTTSYPRAFGYPRAEKVTDAAIDWIEAHREEDFFLYLHYMDTHFPHPLTAEARGFLDPELDIATVRSHFLPNGQPKSDRALTPDERRYLDALYDGGVAYADHHLGRLFDYLDRVGVLDETLIVVTSDHGEHLLEVPGRIDHGGAWYDTVAHVPLILFQPARLEATEVDRMSSAVDLMPTVLALMDRGLPTGTSADGRNLLPRIETAGEGGARPPEIVLSWRGVRTATTKLLVGETARSRVRAWFHEEVPRPRSEELEVELYDLTADPSETRNLARSRISETQRLFAIYLDRLRAPYKRLQRSRRTEAPPTAFAIAAAHFRVGNSKSSQPAAGWSLDRDWQAYGLLAEPGASPTSVAFPVPSGSYDLSVSLRGALRVTLPNGETVEAAGSPVPQGRRRPRAIRGEVVNLGSVEVRENRFHVEVASADATQPLYIRYFGFTPAGAMDPEQGFEDRLRTLGYID